MNNHKWWDCKDNLKNDNYIINNKNKQKNKQKNIKVITANINILSDILNKLKA